MGEDVAKKYFIEKAKLVEFLFTEKTCQTVCTGH